MKQFMITGLGPVAKDGSRKIFTQRAQPFVAAKEWLEAAGEIETGDTVELHDDGSLVFIPQGLGDITQPAAQETASEDKKKAAGSDSTIGLEHSPFRLYEAKPIHVAAAQITAVSDVEHNGDILCQFEDGTTKIATGAMTARMMPAVGDYWVIVPQEEGRGAYEYLNPKAVFEAKYDLLTFKPNLQVE